MICSHVLSFPFSLIKSLTKFFSRKLPIKNNFIVNLYKSLKVFCFILTFLLSHKKFFWMYFNCSITVFGTIVIIAKCTIFEITNNLKNFILSSKVSFLIRHSFITLYKFLIVFVKSSHLEFSCYKKCVLPKFYTLFSQVDIFHATPCHIYIFQNSYSSYFAFT